MNLLYVTHRIPYPPNKGDKIRAYNILCHLAQKHDVFLATLIDEPADQRYIPSVSAKVKEFCWDTIHPTSKKLTSSMAWLHGNSASAAYFYSRKVQHWIDNLIDRVELDAVFCSSSPSAEYLFRSRHNQETVNRLLRVMDFIDVDSYKWQQYAGRKKQPLRLLYSLEAHCLARYEETIADHFDHLLLVSEPEQNLFAQRISSRKSLVLTNGVDLEYFTPSYRPELPNNGPTLVFTGAMDYWPNIEGVEWFVRNVLPSIQTALPDVTFYIVGSHPTPNIRKIAQDHPAIKVTGYVDDIRTYLAAADLSVVPLRIARGIQNKVLEAMAMAKPVVCTPQALEGINAHPQKEVITADTPERFSAAIIRLIKNQTQRKLLGRTARAFVEKNYSWPNNLSLLDTILKPCPPKAINQLTN